MFIKKASDLKTNGTDEWLVDQIIPARSLVFLSAPPKLGKTMIALELSTSIASGKPAFGQFAITKPNLRVLYVAGEDSESGFKKRIDQFAKGKTVDLKDIGLYAVTEQTLLIDSEEGKQALKSALEQIKPDLLVLDNLSRIHRSNENSATAMGEIFEFLQQIKLEYGVTILLVHHMGKDGTLRGSSNILSYYESAMFLKRVNDTRLIDFKFRNYEDRINIPYSIRQTSDAMCVELGNSLEDRESKPIVETPPQSKIIEIGHRVYKRVS